VRSHTNTQADDIHNLHSLTGFDFVQAALKLRGPQFARNMDHSLRAEIRFRPPNAANQGLLSNAHAPTLRSKSECEYPYKSPCRKEPGYNHQRDRNTLELGRAWGIEEHEGANDKGGNACCGEGPVRGRLDIEEEQDKGGQQEYQAKPINRKDAKSVRP
jgi:hypothetical protein